MMKLFYSCCVCLILLFSCDNVVKPESTDNNNDTIIINNVEEKIDTVDEFLDFMDDNHNVMYWYSGNSDTYYDLDYTSSKINDSEFYFYYTNGTEYRLRVVSYYNDSFYCTDSPEGTSEPSIWIFSKLAISSFQLTRPTSSSFTWIFFSE